MHEPFLTALVKTIKASDFKRLIVTSTEEKIKSIVEIICNYKSLLTNQEDKSVLKKYKNLEKYFCRKKQLKISAVRLFLIKNRVLLKTLIAFALSTQIQNAVMCTCDNGYDFASN